MTGNNFDPKVTGYAAVQHAEGLVRALDRGLLAAGIARRVERDGKWVIDKRDDRGRALDIHVLRHTFAAMLNAGKVAP